MPDILDTIDGALTDYGTSPDAMRWSPEPEAANPGPHLYVEPRIQRSIQTWIHVEIEPFREAISRAMRAFAEVWQPVYTAMWKLTQIPPPPRVRTHAAARTRSAQWRAGSRRTKRLARGRRP